jgi:subtilisin family serine protease
MERTSGRPEITIGLVDGPVLIQHPQLAGARVRELPGRTAATCSRATSTACMHGTFVAGILAAPRSSPAPSISPGCTLLVRPIFTEATSGRDGMPMATPQDLATAIVACVDAGARVINLSLGLAQPSGAAESALEDALAHSVRRNVLVIAAAGNQGAIGSSALVRHPWVIPVVACDSRGRPMHESNLGGSIGRRGLSAPGDRITSLGADGDSLTLSGTSAAVPFVTGAVALLWSAFPLASAKDIKLAVTQAMAARRASVAPPLLDAEMAYHTLLISNVGARSA